jgi:hypothetical protein
MLDTLGWPVGCRSMRGEQVRFCLEQFQ